MAKKKKASRFTDLIEAVQAHHEAPVSEPAAPVVFGEPITERKPMKPIVYPRRLTVAIHVYGGDFFGAERSEWDPESPSTGSRPKMPFETTREFRVKTAPKARGRNERTH
jgi:hypothetical protein